MPRVIIIGGGLAGLAAAAALGGAGYEVDLYESRAFFGGRATSWPMPAGDESEVIDNCQHILLKCCVNLMDFYRRLGVDDQIHFYKEFYFIEPGGRMSTLKRGLLPAPAHFTESFLSLRFLSLTDKIAIARATLALLRERRRRRDLDQISMLDWLREQRQPQRAIDRYWNQILVSAVSEDLDRMAAAHGFQVFATGMLGSADSYEMGVPNVPLRELYRDEAWTRIGNVRLHGRKPIESVTIEDSHVTGVQTSGDTFTADAYIAAIGLERVNQVLPGAGIDTAPFSHSPITGIHLWFDRPITDLPHATLLDRTIQWMYNKGDGSKVQLVVSASRSLLDKSRAEVIEIALRELAEFFPAVREARLETAHVIKEVRAVFSAAPGLEAKRPPTRTAIGNLFLAGDWTKTGWPPTMEGAVRSGYLAAEAITAALGDPKRFLVPDVG